MQEQRSRRARCPAPNRSRTAQNHEISGVHDFTALCVRGNKGPDSPFVIEQLRVASCSGRSRAAAASNAPSCCQFRAGTPVSPGMNEKISRPCASTPRKRGRPTTLRASRCSSRWWIVALNGIWLRRTESPIRTTLGLTFPPARGVSCSAIAAITAEFSPQSPRRAQRFRRGPVRATHQVVCNPN